MVMRRFIATFDLCKNPRSLFLPMKERYRIENELKFGRRRRLIDAHDTVMNRRVLCRRVDTAKLDDGEAVNQVNFFSELGAVKHPSTVKVIDRHHDPEDGAWYLVSEWIEGEPLLEWVSNSKEPIAVATIERFIERILGWMAAWEKSRHDFVSIERSDVVVVYDEKGRIDFKVVSGRPSNVRDSLRSFQRLLGWIFTQGHDRRLPAPNEMHLKRPDVPLRLVRWIAWLQTSEAEGGPMTPRDAWVRYFGGVNKRGSKRSPVSYSMISWAAAGLFLVGSAFALFWAFSKSLEDVTPGPATILSVSR